MTLAPEFLFWHQHWQRRPLVLKTCHWTDHGYYETFEPDGTIKKHYWQGLASIAQDMSEAVQKIKEGRSHTLANFRRHCG